LFVAIDYTVFIPLGDYQHLVDPDLPICRYSRRVVVPLVVDPQAVIGYPVSLVTARIQRLKLTQNIYVGDGVSLATTAQIDWGTKPVEQLVDSNAHVLVTADPTARFLALDGFPGEFSRHNAHHKVLDGHAIIIGYSH
jgi:hypothetical protein